MPHLVQQWPQGTDGATSLPQLLTFLRGSHEALSQSLRRVWGRAVNDPNLTGIELKRLAVKDRLGGTQPLQEVVNQLATLERLIDAAEWFASTEDWTDSVVVRCNPTTSSQPGVVDDADLILESPRGMAIIEAVDEINPAGANRKLPRTVARFSEVARELGEEIPRRFYVVIPQERAAYLERERTKTYGLERRGGASTTAVMEWLPQSRVEL